MKPSFAKQASPLIVSVIKEKTTAAVIAAMKNGHIDGAMGYDLHLSSLDPAYLNQTSLETMIAAAGKPVLALNYNQGYLGQHLGLTEEQRVESFLLAAKAGASAVDIQGYTFNLRSKDAFEEEYADECMLFAKVKPKEISLSPELVKKQVNLIQRFHDMDCEVLLSCHTGVTMNREEVLSLALELEKRKPDIIKIVTPCESDEQMLEGLHTILTLKKHLKTKFQYHCSGKKGKPTRVFGPMLGSYLIFCIDRYSESSNLEQLPLKVLADFYRTYDWS